VDQFFGGGFFLDFCGPLIGEDAQQKKIRIKFDRSITASINSLSTSPPLLSLLFFTYDKHRRNSETIDLATPQ